MPQRPGRQEKTRMSLEELRLSGAALSPGLVGRLAAGCCLEMKSNPHAIHTQSTCGCG
jgi:hypothetical protein